MSRTADQRAPARSFEIIHERDLPKRRSIVLPGNRLAALSGSIRAAIEGLYVTLARSVMTRTEDLEDALAARRHVSRQPVRRPRIGTASSNDLDPIRLEARSTTARRVRRARPARAG